MSYMFPVLTAFFSLEHSPKSNTELNYLDWMQGLSMLARLLSDMVYLNSQLSVKGQNLGNHRREGKGEI